MRRGRTGARARARQLRRKRGVRTDIVAKEGAVSEMGEEEECCVDGRDDGSRCSSSTLGLGHALKMSLG